jgi:hypothetical protein
MNHRPVSCLLAFVASAACAATNDVDLAPTAEVVGLLRAHYVDSDRLDAQRVTDATIAGLLQTLGGGAQILTAAQAAVRVTAPGDCCQEMLARAEVIEPDIGYIRVADITDKTTDALDVELGKFLTAKVTGYVLDLRFAGGTNYAAAAAVASRFIRGEPELFVLKEAGQCVRQFRGTEASRVLPVEPSDAPVMVLVNHQTRGAAEVVAATLRAQDRAVVLGGRTTGHAVAWQDWPLRDGRVLRVATTKISLTGGPDIFPGGLTPDVPVKMDLDLEREVVLRAATNITLTASLRPTEFKRAIREADLVRAFRGEALEPPPLALGTNAPPAGVDTNQFTVSLTAVEPRREVRDVVLQRAVDILKGIRVLLTARQ